MIIGKKIIFAFLLFLNFYPGFSQNPAAQDSMATRLNQQLPTFENKQIISRKIVVGGGIGVFYTSSLIALNKAWYKDFARTRFHTFNDGREWLQVDKAGHAWSAYNINKYATGLWQWTGMKHSGSVVAGGLSSLGFLTIIEYLDGHSAKWGWSWPDMAANVAGIGIYSSQELIWKEQRIQYKLSAHTKNYDAPLKERTDDLFGKRFSERLLKDYNNQTYWLSVNLKSFFKQSKLPAWLNIAAGYGADGMYGGFENAWTDKTGNRITRFDIPRVRQFYISPDIDFTKINTNKKAVRTLLGVLNMVKMPAPALMLNSKGKWKAYALYF